MQRLNKTQEKIAYQKQVGVSLIKGAQGSGKSRIAMARMIYLLEHVCKKGEHVLFVSPDKETVSRAKAYLEAYHMQQNVSLFDEEIKGMAIVKSTEELIMEGANKAFVCYAKKIVSVYPEALVAEVIKEVRKQYPRVRWLKSEQVSFICSELDWMNANNVINFEMYQNIQRKGAAIKLPKKGNGRKALWQIKEQVEKRMKEQGLITKLAAAKETLVYLKEDCLKPCYDHMVIDDAEKLTKVELEMLRALWGEKDGEALFLLDPTVEGTLSFLNKGKGFKAVGFDMTGRVKRLSVQVAQKMARKKKVKEVALTPIEAFMLEMAAAKEEVKIAPSVEEKKSTLPWYVETYEFVNKITGVRTVFQKDSSAGETYIDEIKQEEVDVLPIYSDIAAGMPIEIVDEVSGQFELPAELLHHKRNSYILHVQGDSMIGADISDGDYVVIQAGNVQDHEIAAVYYNGATTLKRIVQEEDHVLLVSENPKYRPIVIEDGDFRVMGKLVGVIKPIM